MMTLILSVTSFALYMLLLASLSRAEYLRSNDWISTNELSIPTNATFAAPEASVDVVPSSTERRRLVLSGTRCNKTDVCFNNPGFFNGFRMYKITEIRNGFECRSVCVPTGACLFTTRTGNFFFFTLGYKRLLGWECGKCPKQKGIIIIGDESNATDVNRTSSP